MIHFLSKPKHVKCLSADGRRLSPVRTLTYDSGLVLYDRLKGKNYVQLHTDGTQILYSDIFNYCDCRYTDQSIPVEERISNLANDLYDENKQPGERLIVRFHFALPTNLTDDQLIELTAKIGKEFSQNYSRPIVMCIHKKEGNGTKNYHCHISLPERVLDPSGKWKTKRSKIYFDTRGNHIYNKEYYDNVTGWDIRRPTIDLSLVPRDANGNLIKNEIYARNSVTGHYLYQKRAERGKRIWDCDTHHGKWLESKDLIKMHDDLDICMNEFFVENSIDDHVIRRERAVTKMLKDAGMRYEKIGPNPTPEHRERVVDNNKRYNAFADALEQNLAEERTLLTENEIVKLRIDSSTKKINALHTNESELRSKLQKMERINPITKYVETILQPADTFVNEAAGRYEKYSSMKKGLARPLLQTLEVGLSSTQEEMAKIKTTAPTTKRGTARMNFLSRNAGMMTDLRNGLHYITEAFFPEQIRENASKRWRGLTGWKRLNYVKKRFGETASVIYKEYLRLEGDCPDSEKIIPSPLTVPDMTKIQNQAQSLNDDWKQSVLSDDHIPPSNIEILSEMLSLEGTVLEISTDGVLLLPDTYNPQMSRQIYERELQQIERDEQAEAARKAAEEAAARREAERLETERIAKEKAAEAARIEQERRKAEQRRIEEEKRRSAEQQSASAATTITVAQGAATSSQTGIEHRSTKRDYYELSDRVAIQKLRFMVQMTRRAIAGGTEHFQTMLDGIQYYEIHSQKFTEDAKKYGMDLSQLSDMQSEMKQIWVIVKDEEYKRPAMINQPPENLISLEQLTAEEAHLQDIIKRAGMEKETCIEPLLLESTGKYMQYENQKRIQYNYSHAWKPNFKRQPALMYEDAEQQLRQIYEENTDFFFQSAKKHNISTKKFQKLSDEADKLTSVLNESYVFHYQERKRIQSQSKLKQHRAKTQTQTQTKTKKKTVQRKTAEQQNTVQPELNE